MSFFAGDLTVKSCAKLSASTTTPETNWPILHRTINRHLGSQQMAAMKQSNVQLDTLIVQHFIAKNLMASLMLLLLIFPVK
jgi:hypothetical protein